MGTKKGLLKKFVMCVLAALMLAAVLSACELRDPVRESTYYINDNEANYYNKDHTTNEEAVDEFTDSITALRKYLDSESFVDSGYYMGVDFDIDILDADNNTAGNFALRVQAYLYTYPYEDEDGNPIYKYYENGNFYDENNEEGTRTLVSALEIHNEAIKKSDISIEWYNGATNEVLIGLYFDGVNSNADNPGNILYANIQGYKRSFPDFGDTVIYQQMIRLLVNLSVEGLLESLGLQGDAGTGSINSTLTSLVGENYKRVVNNDLISLFFYSVTLDAIAGNVNELLYDLLGVFGRKWDPMTYKYLGFKFSTVANALIQTIDADLQAIISPDKSNVSNVLTNAAFAFAGVVNSYDVLYTYTSNVRFDYGWTYPDNLTLDTQYYTMFDYGNYEFDGMLYVPAWDAQFDAEIKTDFQQYDNSTNNVFMEFRDIANGELMIGIYYREERSWLDISGLSYMYGWVDVESLGFPQVYDEHLDLAEVLTKFFNLINNVIVSIVDAILDPASTDKENKVLEYILAKTSYTEKIPEDIFSINSETLQIDIELVKQMLEETGVGTFSTRQIINILDSMLPYTLDQIAIMLGIASAEVMLEKTYFTLTWDVDTQEFTVIMYTNVGVEPGEPSTMIFRLELIPIHFGEYVPITQVDFSNFKPLGEIYTYSGTLEGNFIFSSQETVDLSKLLSATIGESSGLNTPYILAQNAGLSFTLIYDQFVKDQYADGVLKKAGRSAFDLTVWLTGSENSIIIGLASDDVCFDNEVYKDLPAREDELGYVWVNIACVTKNGTQVIPKVKIREDVFMASMSAYMNNETSIEDDVTSFADNDFNLSLTSIITALCKDAYVIAAAEQLEITSSNETLQNLFRVNGLIGNIKVDAGFEYRVKGLESIRLQYLMYEVGFFDNITGNSPYDTALHSTLEVFFYEDYMDTYDPLKYDFLVYADNVILDDGTMINSGTIYLYELGARRTVARQTIDYPSSSFFNKENADNQDITKVKFVLDDLILDPSKDKTNDNRLVYESEGHYYYRTYYGKQRQVNDDYIEVGDDGTVYVYWLGITEVLFHEEGATYYFFDRNRAIEDENGDHAFITKNTDRDLLFEYDPESVKITEDCKTQYAPRTNGSFMGEVRRYFVTFESLDSGELGKVETLYYDESGGYPQYYSKADEEYVVEIYDDDGVLISSTKTPIMLYVMEPCEPLRETAEVNVKTDATTTQLKTFSARFVIDWDLASSDKKGYMVVTEVIIAPGMMGEITFPVRIIVVNREIDTDNYVSVYTTEEEVSSIAPVVDEIDVDPYDYAMAKYEYLSNTANFNPAVIHSLESMEKEYAEAVVEFSTGYFAQEKFAFEILFAWQQSYLYANDVGNEYIARSYQNYSNGELTRFDWNFDICPKGSNLEALISPLGGTIYLHSYFRGQLIALKVNIGKREFSHIKFYDGDSFSPEEYNADNDEFDTYVTGIYRGNYYDEETYAIETRPIFVFTDGIREYEYVFDMKLVTGLLKNNDGTYSAAYETIDSYQLTWGNPNITNVTSKGSGYGEYAYSYLYKESEFETLEQRYDALSDAQREKKVKIFRTADKSVIEDYLYVRASDGRVNKRVMFGYSELGTYLSESELRGTVFTVEYGTGEATKYASDRLGNAMVRDTDVEGETVIINRPFYYFYLKTDPDTPVHLTEEEYELYLAGDPEIRGKYGFNTDNSDSITTTGLDLYYLFRLYFSLDNQLYAISTLSNGIIEPDKLNDQAIGVTDFALIELRIEADCPQLEVDSAGWETDRLTGESFEMSKVNAGDETALGYYKVDPLNAETLYLPDSLEIYFKYEDFVSVHEFGGLEWCAYYDADGNPVYTYFDEGKGEYVTLIEPVTDASGKTRYKVAIDVEELTEEVLFRAMVKIGNATSGYREITVAVRILSKDPTKVDFYVNETGKQLETPSTTTEVITGDTMTKLTYYTYYADTFENFKLPDRLVATFSDGHSQTYIPTWKVAKTGADFIFEPDTVVTLMTTIGTDGGVTVDIYLVVVVENYELSKMEVSNEYGSYYVTIKSENGEILNEKVTVSSLFKLDGKEMGYYYQSTSTYYIHISTGSDEDGDTPAGEIGLYTRDAETGRYIWRMSVGVYDFIMSVYSRATLSLNKYEMSMSSQKIIDDKTSIFDHTILMSLGAVTMEVSVRDAVKTTYSYRPAENNAEIMTVEISYTDSGTGAVYTAVTDENGMLTIGYGGKTRKISYAEFASYVINENMAEKYVDWRVSAVNGIAADANGNPFTSQSLLSGFVSYNSDSRTVVISSSLGLSQGGEIQLRNSRNETVSMSYNELVYRLTQYYRYLRVADGTTKTISNKSISINNLYQIMDINDMLIRPREASDPIPDGKYVVELGTGAGSYDMRARVLFTGGYYLTQDSQGTETVTVTVYTATGSAQYADGYILGNTVSATVTAMVNDGTNNTQRFNYNRNATDEKLTQWYVEIMAGGNPTNITGINAGDIITSIPAEAIYTVGKDRQITVSALTSQGFRIRRTIVFEVLPAQINDNYTGGNANSSFAETHMFAITDGLITINNIYDFTNPSVTEYLGSVSYLPTTIYVNVNGRRLSVSNVKWKLDSIWYGSPNSVLGGMTYTGTTGAYVMATAEILGCTDSAGNYFGATTVSLRIQVNSAEVLIMPWETDDRGNGLATETLTENGKMYYRVYVDAYADTDAVRKGAIKTDDSGRRYLELPSDLLVEYTNGDIFTFSGVKYIYGGTREVTRIYFDHRGIDIATMTSSSGDLSGISTSNLSERELSLTVELGLEQSLDIRFYFHNKRPSETEGIVYYTEYLVDGNKVLYDTLPESEKAKKVGTTDKYLFKADEDGYAMSANLLYYYETYYENGVQIQYNLLTDEQKAAVIEGTEIKLYTVGASGYAQKASLVYNDMVAVIDIDDEVIRNAIYEEKRSDLTDYQSSMISGVNLIRVQTNLENVIGKAQEIRSTIRIMIDSISITADVSVTAQTISEKLLAWTTQMPYIGTYDESALPSRTAYNDDESYNYALDKLIQAAKELAYYDSGEMGYYVSSILNVITGSGSNTSKERTISERIQSYFEEFVENGFNAAIRGCVEKEYVRLFTEELEGMTDEEYNSAVYYKNMIEAGFDAESVVADIYKLRSFKKSGISEELAAKQLDIEKARSQGFGFVIEYVDYTVGGRQIMFTDLSEEDRTKTVSYGSGAEVKVYRQGENGQAQILNEKLTYDELAYAVIMQAVYEAYEYADGNITGANEYTENIKNTVIKLFENRLDVNAHRFGGSAYEGNKAVTYTFGNFVTGYAYNTTATYLTKKVMSSYLENAVKEAMDFTAFTQGDREAWNEYEGLFGSVIAYTYNYIANYETTINSLRRSLVSGSSVTNVLRNLIASGIKSYSEHVYMEAEYAMTVNNIQEINGQIIPVEKYGEEGYSLDRFAALLDENLAKYLIEPYYAYRGVPHKIRVYFQGDDIFDDESGLPYETAIVWTTDEVSGIISYAGVSGKLQGTLVSPVTEESTVIRMAAIAERRVLADSEKVITTEYIEDGLVYAGEANADGKLTSDGRYYMTKAGASYIYYYKYNSEYTTPTEYQNNVKVSYTLKYEERFGKKIMSEYSGYDATATIVYSFINEYGAEGTLERQSLYVYNPFEFSQVEDMPTGIYVGGQLMTVRWNDVGTQPTGNITTETDGSQQVLRGKIESDAGQDVEISVFVAKWSYAGIYRRTDAASGIIFDAEGVEQRFVYMSPLNFYFSAYMSYSPEDYYLVAFAVRILMPDPATGIRGVKRIIFEEDVSGAFIGVKVQDKEEGFVRKLFYPENSRLLEYGTDDDTMDAVNSRNRYVMYWEELQKNKVISGQISQQDGCLVYLGNSDVGQFTLEGLKEQSDTVAPTKAVYSCERMTISQVGFVTVDTLTTEVNGNTVTLTCGETGISYVLDTNNMSFVCNKCGGTYTALGTTELLLSCSKDGCEAHGFEINYNTLTGIGTCNNETCVLYNEIKDVLLAQSGQAAVAISPDGYLPTTGQLVLRENNVHYREDELRVRFLWGNSYESVLGGLSGFVRYAYPDVEDASVRNFSKNILMTWDLMSKNEQNEMIELAKEYKRMENEYLGSNYTDEMCTQDAYKMLAINEKYDYSKDINRLRGGGNNNVTCTVLIGVDGSNEIYIGTVVVKVLFADYTPFGYYRLRGSNYEEITNSLTKEDYFKAVETGMPFNNELYIAVRGEYWNAAQGKPSYETDGKNSVVPYDNIGDEMYKLLQIYAERNAYDGNGAKRDYIGTDGADKEYLIRVSSIEWTYDESTGRITSKSFVIGGTTFESDLLQLILQ